MMVEARSEEEARQVILADLEIDPGSYDNDLEPVSEATGDMKVTTSITESLHDPGPWRAEPGEAGQFAIKDANGFTVAYVYARQDKALWGRFLSPAEALTIATAIAKLPELIIAEGRQGAASMNSRETAMLDLAKRLNFHVEQHGSRFSLRRVADVSEPVEVVNLSLEEAEEFLNNWKLRGFHGG
jgi:hypothetical protein